MGRGQSGLRRGPKWCVGKPGPSRRIDGTLVTAQLLALIADEPPISVRGLWTSIFAHWNPHEFERSVDHSYESINLSDSQLITNAHLARMLNI